MAKTSAAPAAPASAPATVPVLQALTSNPIPTEVVKWGNGSPAGEESPQNTPDAPRAKPEAIEEAGEGEGAQETERPAKTKREPLETKAKPEEEEPGEGEGEGDEEEAPKPAAKGAERRRQLMEVIERDKKTRAIEEQVSAERARAEKAAKELEDIRKAPLAKKLAWLGIPKADLVDKLLIGADDTEFEPEKAAPAKAESPEVAELKAQIAELKTMLTPTIQAREQEQWAQAEKGARESLKGVDLPLVKAMRGGVQRSIMLAHDMWKASGKSGPMTDYLEDAAAEVEDQLAAEEPEVAAIIRKRAKAAAEDEGEEEAPAEEERAARPTSRVAAVGKRTGRRTNPKEEALPIDPYERDKMIKKMFGFRDG